MSKPESDVIDRLLALSSDKQRDVLTRLAPDQLKVVKTKIQQRKASKSLIPSRQAASRSEMLAHLPEFEKPGYNPVKTALDAPLDVAIGVEKAVGLDPMHPISSAPAAIANIGKGLGRLAGYESLSSGWNPMTSLRELQSMLEAVPAAAKRGGAALREQNLPEAFQAVGEGYAAGKTIEEGARTVARVSKPAIADLRQSAKEAANRANVPTRLLKRAEANRQPIGRQPWQERAVILGPSSAIGYALGGPLGAAGAAAGAESLALIRRSDWYRGMKANAQEAVARSIDPEARSGGVPAEEQERIGRIEPPPRAPFVSSEKLNIERPRVSDKVKEELEIGRAEQVPRLQQKRPPGPIVEHEFTPSEEMTSGEPGWRNIEQKIDPKGEIWKRAVQMVDERGQPTKFGRELVEQVPELTTASKGPKADAALMDGYRRTLQRVNEVEDATPEDTTVEKTPILSQLNSMAMEYLDRGLDKTADMIQKLADSWLELPERIPWNDFLSRKRSFFKERNLRSAPMRQAYGVLMEASERANPQLSVANRAYSVVRRALDAAKIDTNTGRRITEVGKAPKGGGSIAERIEQSQPRPQTPTRPVVENRQQAMELLQGEQPARSRPAAGELGRVGGALPNPEIEASAASDMELMASDIREMQAAREVGRQGVSEESNAEGKELEEQVRDEWNRVGKSFGIDLPDELVDWVGKGDKKRLAPWSPDRVANAIEKGSGKDFEKVKAAFVRLSKEGFSAYRESQRESGTGPGELRRRAFEAIRRRSSKE